MMSGLKLYGMRSAYDETLATAIKRKHEPQRFVGDLLKAEISEKQARSIKYQLTVAKLPLANRNLRRRPAGIDVKRTLWTLRMSWVGKQSLFGQPALAQSADHLLAISG